MVYERRTLEGRTKNERWMHEQWTMSANKTDNERTQNGRWTQTKRPSISLKAMQCYSLEAVYGSHDVFVWLPTGYGKSLCYQALPFIMHFKLGLVRSHKHSLVLRSHGKLEPKGPYCVRKRHTWNPAYLQYNIIFKLCIIDLYLSMHMHKTVCTRPSPQRPG